MDILGLFPLRFGQKKFLIVPETIIHVEIGLISYRMQYYSQKSNDKGRKSELCLFEKDRERAMIGSEAIKQRVSKFYNRHVRSIGIKTSSYVLKKLEAVGKDLKKIRPNWERPYLVTKSVNRGSYKLQDQKERKLLWP